MNREIKISAFDTLSKQWVNNMSTYDNYVYNALTGKWMVLQRGKLELLNFNTELIVCRHSGKFDKNRKAIIEGDMYSEEIEESDGDTVLNTICTWIDEYSSFCMLSDDEYEGYLVRGIDDFDTMMRFSYMMDEADFKKRVFRGNVNSNPELIKI